MVTTNRLTTQYRNAMQVGQKEAKRRTWYATGDLEIKLSNVEYHGFISELLKYNDEKMVWYGRYCPIDKVVSINTYPFRERVPTKILKQLHCIFPDYLYFYYKNGILYDVY